MGSEREITSFARFHKGVADRNPEISAFRLSDPRLRSIKDQLPSTEDGSTFTPGPIVEVMAMRCT